MVNVSATCNSTICTLADLDVCCTRSSASCSDGLDEFGPLCTKDSDTFALACGTKAKKDTSWGIIGDNDDCQAYCKDDKCTEDDFKPPTSDDDTLDPPRCCAHINYVKKTTKFGTIELGEGDTIGDRQRSMS